MYILYFIVFYCLRSTGQEQTISPIFTAEIRDLAYQNQNVDLPQELGFSMQLGMRIYQNATRHSE